MSKFDDLSISNINCIIGMRIKHLRIAKGYTQKELSEKIGSSFQYIQKYERGTVNITVCLLDRIAKVFEVDLLYFFNFHKTPQTDDCVKSLHDVTNGLDDEFVDSLFKLVDEVSLRYKN